MPPGGPRDVQLPRRSWVEHIMGMPISVLARGPAAHLGSADGVVAAAFAELRDIDATFSPYKPDSAVAAIRAGRLSLAGSPPAVRAVAGLCTQAHELTKGLFDANRPDGSWDPSGLVKGWAVERAAGHLAQVPELDWCLNAGGDVAVRCGGGRSFTVGIEDPNSRGRLVEALSCTSGGVATSGTAARGQHIYDPHTGAMAGGPLASVTVAGPSLMLADVLATAAFVAGGGWESVVGLVSGYVGFAVRLDGTRARSPGWPAPDPGRG